MTPSQTVDPLHVPLKLGGQTVPGFWRFLLPQALLRGEFPAERRATCGACPMIETDGFRPDYRCCTYHPRIPGFLLGLALAREVSSKAVDELIAGGYVLPEGTERTPAMWRASLKQGADGQWGKGDTVLCPLLETKSGFCKIHAYRNATCSTYFCLYDFGARSSRFWELIQEYIGAAETALGQWSLRLAGFDLAGYFARFDQLASQIDRVSQAGGGWSAESRAYLWGDWFGRERELLKLCADAVSAHRNDLVAIAAMTPILRPAIFEAAETAGIPSELKDFVDPRDLVLTDTEALPLVPMVDLGHLASQALAALWSLPAPGVLVQLQEGAQISSDGLLRFLPQEGDEPWELRVDAHEAAALRYFAKARAFSAEFLAQGPMEDLPDPARFVAEWLGYGVLIEAKPPSEIG